MDNLPIQQTNPRKIIMIKEGPAVQRKWDKNSTPLISHKKNITVFLVMSRPLLARKGRKIMAAFKENFEISKPQLMKEE